MEINFSSRNLKTMTPFNFVPRVSDLTAPWGELGGGNMRDAANEVGHHLLLYVVLVVL